MGNSFFKTPKIRSKKHREYVSQRASILSGARAEVAHHLLRVDAIKGMGTKSCDRWVVPMTHAEHDALHKAGDEVAFFARHGLDYEFVKERARVLCKSSPCNEMRDL